MNEGEKQACKHYHQPETTTRATCTVQVEVLSRLSQKPNCLATRRTSGSTPLLDSVADLLRPAQQIEPIHVRTQSKSARVQHNLPAHDPALFQHRCWTGSPLQPGKATLGGDGQQSLHSPFLLKPVPRGTISSL